MADEREKDGPMPEIEMVTVEEPPKPRELYHIASRVLDIPRMERVYKLQRAVVNLKAPLAAPLYHMTDMELTRFGRKVRARLYTPEKEDGGCLILFFHGGGWVTESVDSYHGVCAKLADELGAKVISVEYGLAPEHRFPVGLEDCFAAAAEIFAESGSFGYGSEDIVLMGDSAGGSLAAAVSLMGRDREMFTVRRQVLLYPATYNDHSPETSPFPSIRENGEGYILTAKRLCEYWELYLSPDDWYDPYAAPLLEKNLSRQPDTLVITAGLDPLRDEGEAYGWRLREAGNWAEVCRMEEALHGFISRVQSPEFARACELMRGFLRRGKEDSDGKE